MCGSCNDGFLETAALIVIVQAYSLPILYIVCYLRYALIKSELSIHERVSLSGINTAYA